MAGEEWDVESAESTWREPAVPSKLGVNGMTVGCGCDGVRSTLERLAGPRWGYPHVFAYVWERKELRENGSYVGELKDLARFVMVSRVWQESLWGYSRGDV